jgi:hypothetical protein
MAGRARGPREALRLLAAVTLVAALPLASGSATAEERSLRCSGGLINRGMVDGQVVAKCGAPQRKDVEDVPVRVRRSNGTVGVAGSTRIERWIYDRGYGQFPARLTFQQGKLQTIELLTDR